MARMGLWTIPRSRCVCRRRCRMGMSMIIISRVQMEGRRIRAVIACRLSVRWIVKSGDLSSRLRFSRISSLRLERRLSGMRLRSSGITLKGLTFQRLVSCGGQQPSERGVRGKRLIFLSPSPYPYSPLPAVGLSLSFSSDYFEVPPEFIITTHAPAARKSYTLTITPLLSQFILKNANLAAGFPYKVDVMLTWPPQTDPLGAVVARDAFTLDSSSSSSSSSEHDVATATSAEAEMSTSSLLSVAPTPTEPILCGRNTEHRC
ncbi:hypothetical protein BDZ88DRAFT_407165 [Geranomyces variabilis]|nr:hypothetical protein BDZ88DRAFT_407165 [Geranomyces variabilis]